jgi:hypothetical protein
VFHFESNSNFFALHRNKNEDYSSKLDANESIFSSIFFIDKKTQKIVSHLKAHLPTFFFTHIEENKKKAARIGHKPIAPLRRAYRAQAR